MKLKSLFLLFFIAILTLGLSGCGLVYFKLYGIKTVKQMDHKSIVRQAKKQNIPVADLYELDTAYLDFLDSFDTTQYNAQQKNHFQPLQALYYSKEGQMVSFQINCYAGGFPNLNWERNGIMTAFPPKLQAPLDSLVSLETQLKFCKSLPQTEKFSVEDYDFVVVVHWNRMMGRQSRRFVKVIQNNSRLAGNKKIRIVYVNSDNTFLEIE